MEVLSPSFSTTITSISNKFPIQISYSTVNVFNPTNNKNHTKLSLSSSQSSPFSYVFSSRTKATVTASITTPLTSPPISSNKTGNRHWMVLMESPPHGVNSKPQIVDYYVKTLERVLGSEKYAQMCIYDVSCDTHFGFCCDIDEEASRELASLPGVLSVRPDPDYNSEEKDYGSNIQATNLSKPEIRSTLLFPAGTTKYWLVRMDKPGVGVVTKAQMVDYYAEILTKVLGNEKDAQMCIYHVSWRSNFGFCCELDEECAQEVASVPGVLSVQPDKNFGSENKDYGGNNIENSVDRSTSSETSQTPVKTKKLFVTGSQMARGYTMGGESPFSKTTSLYQSSVNNYHHILGRGNSNLRANTES
ncbi:organelle RRM domain-containing protein 1, chloroplastic isoform X2 [Manihot esculenta]|uniref:organelle RRM domain-containing protein 1, chloroplastic isoform X2 n=1 Tax=Manihot esculenta TaxID=3983 RepID=UPI001CC4CCDB|nr:organelle RRM domain-containing protein 1, chloroplastic isoform X2 [Manihot esculenta]